MKTGGEDTTQIYEQKKFNLFLICLIFLFI